MGKNHADECEACRTAIDGFVLEMAKKDARIKELEDINAVINSNNFGKVIAERIHMVIDATRRAEEAESEIAKLTKDLESGFMQGAYTRLKNLQAAEWRVGELEAVLYQIKSKWVKALLRDAREADKTDCNAQSIWGICVRAGITEEWERLNGK